MESLDEVIGSEHASELSFDSPYGAGNVERWYANFWLLDYSDEDAEEPGRTLVASARLVRVGFDDDWADSLDAEAGDLSAIAAALCDVDVLFDIDVNALAANSLLIIDFVGVPEEHRGRKVSHAFVRGIAHIFRGEVVALLPASLSTDEHGELRKNKEKLAALTKHWKQCGFVKVPKTKVMVLPIGER